VKTFDCPPSGMCKKNEYGGAVTHAVTVDGQDDAQNWHFFNNDKDFCQDSLTNGEGDGTPGACETSDSCANEETQDMTQDSGGYSIGWFCTPLLSPICSVAVGKLDIAVPKSAITGPYTQEALSAAPTGASCAFNFDCSSRLCIQGTCHEELLGTLEGCLSRWDCKSVQCAIYNGSTDFALQCCPAGSIDLGNGQAYCLEQPTGAPCVSTDLMCKSQTCVQGTCRDGKQDVGEDCEKDDHCQNTVCALDHYENRVCCPTGQRQVTHCIHAAGELCAGHDACTTGRCAFEFYREASKNVCCPSGNAVELNGVPWAAYPLFYVDFCTGHQSGDL